MEKNNIEKTNNKLFISHSSKDFELVKRFIEQILILGLEIKREEIFCTSLDGTNIKSGNDFKKAIYNELNSAKAIIQIITKNYKTSEICLNEMGAAWVLSETVIPLVGNPYSYDVGFINATSQQLKLNVENDLLKFYDDHKSTLFTNSVNISNYITQIKEFLKYQERFTRFEEDNEINYFYNCEYSIKGILRNGIFGHPPAESFEEHHSYHEYYFLELNTSINVLNKNLSWEEGEYNASHFNVFQIHIIPASDDICFNLKSLKNKNITVKGEFWSGFTAWHQTNVMMSYTDIKVLD